MNYSTAVFLINDKARAVMCTYESALTAKRILFKTLDHDIVVGDYVVVPTDTRHGMTVVRVVEVDVELDFDDPTQIQWIIGRVNRLDYEDLLAREEEAINTIKAAEKKKKRDELRDSIFAHREEMLNGLKLTYIDGQVKSIDAS
jgi:hypothetical protein